MRYVLLCTALISGSALAADLNDSMNRFCEKVKACSLSQMDQESMDPQMRAMMENMLQGMCDEMFNFDELMQNHELAEPATLCMDSMAAMDCATLMDDPPETQACQNYRQQAEQYQ